MIPKYVCLNIGGVYMFIACDGDNNRINISFASKKEVYYCPICKGELIIKDGQKNAKHFAHKQRCICKDDWSYDMSEWHRQKQSYFPIENREIVLNNGKEIHRADILIDKTVIEFQHSNITKEEFSKRNNFYHSLGLRIAWVFDVSNDYESEKMSYLDKDDGLMKWKNPKRIFDDIPFLNDDNKEFSLWFSWDSNTENEDIIYKVIETVKDKKGNNNFSEFRISPYSINLASNPDINTLFMSKIDYDNLEEKNHKLKKNKRISDFKSDLYKLKEQFKYTVKYMNIDAKADECYICPITNEKNINVHNGCCYCKYCYMIAQNEADVPLKSAIYCCYPTQCREIIKDDSEHECPKVKFHTI